MELYKLVLCLCCVMIGLTEGSPARKRREDCVDGEYPHDGNTCCLCPSGFHLLSHCNTTHDRQCEKCVFGISYMSHPNSEKSCRPCITCQDENAKMKEKEKCTLYFDTVCECQENHFCDKGDQCRICYPCDMCEETGVKTACTPTSNTVCNDTKEPNGIVALAIVLPLLLLLIVILIIIWRKRKLCFKDKKEPEKLLIKPLLEGNIGPYLPEIASELGWTQMKNVALRTGMTKANIEEHSLNHPGDVAEQTLSLLQAWYQRQGLKGAYPTLIKTLNDMKKKAAAEKVQEIVAKGEASTKANGEGSTSPGD